MWVARESPDTAPTPEMTRPEARRLSRIVRPPGTTGHRAGSSPGVVAAVEALQKAHGLPATGAVDRATDAALQTDLQVKGGRGPGHPGLDGRRAAGAVIVVTVRPSAPSGATS